MKISLDKIQRIAYYLKRLSFILAFICAISACWSTNPVMYLKISMSSLLAMCMFYVIQENSTPFKP